MRALDHAVPMLRDVWRKKVMSANFVHACNDKHLPQESGMGYSLGIGGDKVVFVIRQVDISVPERTKDALHEC
jgi:hypothetical protein